MTKGFCSICQKITEVESDAGAGNTICGECGCILEENALVAEVSFQENSAGQSAVVGSFVSATGPKSLSASAKQFNARFSRASREATLANGRRMIQQVGSALGLGPSLVEAANRLFMRAVNQQFIQGRRTANVVAVCLYIAARRTLPPSPYMLIDFSDVLQTNVFVLGGTLLKFMQLCEIRLPLIDPSVYVLRFANKLEFGDQTNVVANTATTLLKQMQRDWLVQGRRPSGVCGACLLIAARIHGFRRTQKEIVTVVRVGDSTVRHRLEEFEQTPTGKLTLEQFEDLDALVDTMQPCDPPALLRNKEAMDTRAENQSKGAPLFTPPRIVGGRNESLLLIEAQKLAKKIQQEAEEKGKEDEAGASADADVDADGAAAASSSQKDVVDVTDEEDAHEDSFSDIDDAELEAALCTPQEAKLNAERWTDMNQDWLDAQAERKRIEADQLARGITTSGRKRKKKKSGSMSASEAAMEALAAKKVPKQIFNQGAVEALLGGSAFDDADGGTGTSAGDIFASLMAAPAESPPVKDKQRPAKKKAKKTKVT